MTTMSISTKIDDFVRVCAHVVTPELYTYTYRWNTHAYRAHTCTLMESMSAYTPPSMCTTSSLYKSLTCAAKYLSRTHFPSNRKASGAEMPVTLKKCSKNCRSLGNATTSKFGSCDMCCGCHSDGTSDQHHRSRATQPTSNKIQTVTGRD